jgi:hypothetical protein
VTDALETINDHARPRFQFSLRTLMVFVTLTAVFFSLTYTFNVGVGIGAILGGGLVISGVRKRRRTRTTFGVILCGFALLLTQLEEYTTYGPPTAQVVGHFKLSKQNVSSNGVAAPEGQPCEVELRADGTFTGTNLPPDPFRSSEPTGTLVTCSGTWRIAVVSSDGYGTDHWGIRFESQPAVKSTHLVGRRAPYSLEFVIGDPDCGEYMRFKKAK